MLWICLWICYVYVMLMDNFLPVQKFRNLWDLNDKICAWKD